MRGAWMAVLVLCLLPEAASAGILSGAGDGALSHVKVFDGGTGVETLSFLAYGATFTGGVRVAAGDLNGDGVPDIITGAGAGGSGHVKVFDGDNGAELRSFLAYGGSFTGGVFVGGGDVNHDLAADLVTGADEGAPSHVKVFDGNTSAEIRSFFAYTPSFLGGVRVATGDLNGDGFADIITGAGAAGSGHVKVFDGSTGVELRSFLAYGDSFTRGVYVAGGDVNSDGFADIITGADAGALSHVKVFDGVTNEVIRSFFAYDATFTGGVRVAAGDLNGDGYADIVAGAGEGGSGLVKVFDGLSGTERLSILAYGPGYGGGVYVGAGDLVVPEPSGATISILALAALALGRCAVRRR